MPFINAVKVDEDFMAPVNDLLEDYIRNKLERDNGLSDQRFIHLGITRSLEGDESGRAFLQALADHQDGRDVARATWFDALQSKRRLGILTNVATTSYRHFERSLKGRDWLEAFPELRLHPVWAVDGHQIEHACHSPRNAKGEYDATGLTYGLCLHTGLLRPLARFQGDGVRRHEWPVFKEHWRKWIIDEPRKGMPIVVADPAYIDCQYWILEKIRRQAMVITREKENMKPTIYGANPFDPKDPVNQGVESDELAGYSNAALRRIRYLDPATQESFVFVTTCNHLRPGLIALLYFMRWKIEKVYDVFKNKLKSQKAWAVGENAALVQGHFMALLHNLLTVLLARLEDHGLHELKLEAGKTRRLFGNPTAPAQQMIKHAIILTCQFIRLVRHCLRSKISWAHALPLFSLRLHAYL
jgi:hypothetical protein